MPRENLDLDSVLQKGTDKAFRESIKQPVPGLDDQQLEMMVPNYVVAESDKAVLRARQDNTT